MNRIRLAVSLILVALSAPAIAQTNTPWSQNAANAVLTRWPAGRFAPPGARWVWNYELGTLLEGIDAVWLRTGRREYYDYIKASVDPFLGEDGSISKYNRDEYQLDNILLGRQLLLLYGVTQETRYAKAATLLYEQLQHQPRTPSGGFWHKQKYPDQMWLDGLYMAEPFYAEYAATFHRPEAYADIAHQFALMETHTRDAKSGLLHHGWDESRKERWADKRSGLSSQFWARAMGWHMMALTDTLDYLPADGPESKLLRQQLARDAEAIVRVQDRDTGLWFQVLDKPHAKGNYLESSASCMFVYALAKGVRRGYLQPVFLKAAERGYAGILRRFVTTGPDGLFSLTTTVKAAGLGGAPYRDGSYESYIGEKVVSDDPKGVGAFLLASTEMENAAHFAEGRSKTVLLDAWFNSQTRTNAMGNAVSFHYKWNDQSNSGYSLLGSIFRDFGAQTATLYGPPTPDALGQAQVYIVVSPDIPAKNPRPHYMQPEDVESIAAWVRAGGVLLLMENDPGNADLEHVNPLAEKFGLHFNPVLRNQVEDDRFEMGRVSIQGEGEIFHHSHQAFMKEICTLSLVAPARPVLMDRGDVLLAQARYGKGTVFAAVDPWLYNEYLDGRKLPAEYDNFAAARELVAWILVQACGPRQGN